MVHEHLLKLTVAEICERSHAFVTDYYPFRDVIMDSKVKHLLFKRAPKYKNYTLPCSIFGCYQVEPYSRQI